MKDRDDVIARAFTAGISDILLTGTDLHKSQQALKLAQHYPHCRFMAGVHLHDSSRWQPLMKDEIIVLANQSEVVAIGGCGLDFNRNSSTPQEQERVFEAQLHIVAELQMPVFTHCRDIHEHSLMLLEPWLDSLPDAALYCFTGMWQEIQDCADRGFCTGITGWACDERHRMELQELLSFIPIKRLLIETDAPHLLPRDLTPKLTSRHNESAYPLHILERIAHQCGEDPQWLSAAIDTNVRTLFEVTFQTA